MTPAARTKTTVKASSPRSTPASTPKATGKPTVPPTRKSKTPLPPAKPATPAAKKSPTTKKSPTRPAKPADAATPATETRSPEPPASFDKLSENIGRAIRNRRQDLGLTMADLAATANLSQPFLSKVERGIGRMSMSAIDRVARALGTSAVGLFAGTDAPVTIDVVRKSERPTLPAYEHDDGMGQALTRRSGQLRVVEFDSGPADFWAIPYVHRNDSVCVVLSGEYEFEFDGTTRFTLGEGDSVSSSGGVNQRYRVLRQPARLLLILVSEDVDVVPRHDNGR